MINPDKTGAYQPKGSESPAVIVTLPEHIGRYRVEKILGGIVCLARDKQLECLVAVKVPHGDRISTAEDAEAYLTEACTVANLDHPNKLSVMAKTFPHLQ